MPPALRRVDDHPPLAALQVQDVRGEGSHHRGGIHAREPPRILPARRLHLDDVGAEVGEDRSRVRAGDDRGEVDDLQTCECLHDRGPGPGARRPAREGTLTILADVDVPSATRALGALTADRDGPPLDRGALLIAAAFAPEVDVDRELGLLDALAQGARGRVTADLDPLAAVNNLNEYLFDHVGFSGNETDYYDPRNSLLHEVVRRRLGIPVTLSLVYIETGRRLGIPLVGIGMPGHFLVRHRREESLFVDPFYGGALLSASECAERLRRISGAVRWHRSFLEPVSRRDLLARMLRNLAALWGRTGRGRERDPLARPAHRAPARGDRPPPRPGGCCTTGGANTAAHAQTSSATSTRRRVHPTRGTYAAWSSGCARSGG